MDIEGKAKREAGFPGDSFTFEASPPQEYEGETEWSGGGEPAAGSGPRFTTVFGSGGTGWTCNTVIRFKRARRAGDLPDEPTLIHELGHVWEHQTGQAQVLKGLVEQTGKLLGHDPYDFGGAEGVKRAMRLTDFSKESQAQILMEYWMSQHGFDSDSNGVSFSTPGYVEDLRRLVQAAGIGSLSRRRRTFAGVIDSGVGRVVNALLRMMERSE